MEEIDHTNLSKGQRKRLKREQRQKEKELERAERKMGGRIKNIRNYSIALLVVIAIAAFFYWRSIPPKDAPIIEITPNSYDFGPVSQARGIASTEMAISNKGSKPLVLDNMETSCGCTSASVVYNGVESPMFSMAAHGTNPRGWKQAILPGESAKLRVYYDPNVHGTLRGPATRYVYVFSNDPRNGKEGVRISLVQVD